MTVTTLDPNTALIVIDLQKGIVAYPTVHPIGEVVERCRLLADAFRQRGLPVVLVNVAGGAPGRTEQSRPSAPFPAGLDRTHPRNGSATRRHRRDQADLGAFASTPLERG